MIRFMLNGELTFCIDTIRKALKPPMKQGLHRIQSNDAKNCMNKHRIITFVKITSNKIDYYSYITE